MEDRSYRQWPISRKLAAICGAFFENGAGPGKPRPPPGRDGEAKPPLQGLKLIMIFKENSGLYDHDRRCERRYGRPAGARQGPHRRIVLDAR